jgi:hypothetical protein
MPLFPRIESSKPCRDSNKGDNYLVRGLAACEKRKSVQMAEKRRNPKSSGKSIKLRAEKLGERTYS